MARGRSESEKRGDAGGPCSAAGASVDACGSAGRGDAPAGACKSAGSAEAPSGSRGPAGSDAASGPAPGSRGGALRAWLAALPRIPLAFLGLGVYRAWLNILFEDGLTTGASGTVGISVSQNAFDLVMIVALLACALCARRLTPLWPRRWARWTCAGFLTGSTLLTYAFWLGHIPLALVGWPFLIMGGVGIALMILLWSELYGMLSPTRICLYYAASLVVGAALGWVFRGFDPVMLPLAAATLPLISLRCLWNCHRSEQVADVRTLEWARFSFPWKPVLVIAVYSFAYGLLQTSIAGVARPNTAPGTVLCALAIAGVILVMHNRVDFGALHGAVLPFVSAVFLVLAAVGGLSPWWANLCANVGYTASQVFIMTMIGSICYHWGASAVWLFGIERAVRSLAMMGGRGVEGALSGAGLTYVPLLVVVVMAVTFVALREGRLSSAWGVRLAQAAGEQRGQARSVEDRGSLTRACSALAAARNLSQREEEVLLLLAQHKTARDIERELCVANGTAKAHIRHVYQKLDIHAREELFAQVEQARQAEGALGA